MSDIETRLRNLDELAETVALRFGIEPVPDSVVQSVLYYLRSLPTDDNGVYVHLIGHQPGSLLKEQHTADNNRELSHLRSSLSQIVAECSQEGCDGEPWDTFQDIARKGLDAIQKG